MLVDRIDALNDYQVREMHLIRSKKASNFFCRLLEIVGVGLSFLSFCGVVYCENRGIVESKRKCE